jgi:hypothetical protein
MTLAQCFDSAGKHPAFWRRAAGFTAFVLLLSLPAWSDVYARIEKLGQKCRGGDREACAELFDLARNEKDGRVRIAAASMLTDDYKAQLIFASIAKYDVDEAVRGAAVARLTDRALLEDVSRTAKDGAVRAAAAHRLAGEDLPAAGGSSEAAGAAAPPEESTPPAVAPPTGQGLERGAAGLRIGMVKFVLRAGANYAFGLGVKKIKGDIYTAEADLEEMPYLQALRQEVIRTVEATLAETGAFQYVPAKALDYAAVQDESPWSAFIRNNGLQYVLSVDTGMGVCVGWKKKVNLTTLWKVSDSSGAEMSIKTYVKSKKTQGMFPNNKDPELQPVWIELARESALQFLEKYAAALKGE